MTAKILNTYEALSKHDSSILLDFPSNKDTEEVFKEKLIIIRKYLHLQVAPEFAIFEVYCLHRSV